MTKHIPDDGGPAFPAEGGSDSGLHPSPGMSRRDYFAAHAPEPSSAAIELQANLDRARNPHNDYGKPKRRSHGEIVADLKFSYADEMIAASRREVER